MEDANSSHAGYLRLVRRIAGHWRLSLAIFGAIALPVAVWALLFLPKSYEATATIFLEDPRRTPSSSLREWIPASDASFQQALLRSRSLAEAVVENLPHESMDELLARGMHRDYVLTAQNLLRRLSGREPVVYSAQQRAVGELQGARVRFTASPSGEVEIRAIAYHPRVAMDLANTYVEVLRLRSRSHVRDEARATRQFIETLLAQTKASLHEAEEGATKLQRRGVTVKSPERSSFEMAQLAQLENALADIQASREIARVRLAALKGGKPAPAGLAPLQRPNDRLVALEAKLAGLREKYTDEHPQVKATQAEIREAKTGLAAALEPSASPRSPSAAAVTQIADLELEVSSLQAREELTRQRIAKLNATLSALGSEDMEQAKLMRKVEAQRTLVTTLTEKLGTARVQEQGDDRGLRVIDLATMPLAPSNAPARKMIMLGTLLALGLGVGVAGVIEYFNQPIETEDDIAEATGLHVLGWLPTVAASRNGHHVPKGVDRAPLSFVDGAVPDTLPVEGCRGIRTSLEWLHGQGRLRAVMMASAGPGEGKSTIALNLGWVFWELGRRLVMIDADLRRPSLHHALRCPVESGLAEVLAARLPLAEAGRTVREGFTFLPAGSMSGGKPGVLLTAPNLRPFLDAVKERSDFVLFDSAPVLAVADNLILASLVDGVILVARAGTTQRRDLVRAKETLERAGATILGAVLNRVSPRETRRYQGRYGDYYMPRDATTPRTWWERCRAWGHGVKGVLLG